ncbi:cdc48-dependent protein degradation adaptor protein [Grosmannia clavigera kw1407]|uniref:Cdc48-dependent protein degradation adaptor protein n=1 Tax=Grosmannia clavigera (strain kw1407 / UAMH 11150) TaxID=655863 RepID=F0XJM7_GROCL|nr:cdc48-dependent protein degradation adaptor protein [Grosmannia clavigera kw1407]EFX02062.1 cdc48-dependent protein degradation adaptor protein [Grosmannia clavigera kw1407]
MTSHDERISEFCSITGVSPQEAAHHLAAADWDNNVAVAAFFQRLEAEEGQNEPSATPAAPAPAEPAYTGPRTLDGRPAPSSIMPGGGSSSQSSKASTKRAQKKKGVMTLSSLKGGGSGHDHEDEDEEEDEEDETTGRGDLFAGGEKSGLAVQDPNAGGHANDAQKMIRDILAKAKANTPRTAHNTADGPAEASSSRSWGSGQTLGGEGQESRSVPDSSGRSATAAVAAAAAAAGSASPSGAGAGEAVQERMLHIWQDGFSIDDGPLHRFDDPANAADLQMIRQGRAPLHLMNVQLGQPVDVKLHQHEEKWHQPPRVYRPFSGEGRRLGSPVPGAASAPISTATIATTTTTATTTTAQSSTAAPAADASQPTVMIRVALPDGTRLPARFNTTQTIGDVYAFVERALPAAQTAGRSWVLATFPSMEHTDRSLVLGETAEFKRGGAAMVKWV